MSWRWQMGRIEGSEEPSEREMDEFEQEEEEEEEVNPAENQTPEVVIEVKLKNKGEERRRWKGNAVLSRLCAIRRIIVKTVFVAFTVTAVCGVFWLEGNIIRQNIPIYTLGEMKQVETVESTIHLKNFVLILWTFVVYTLISEMMHILGLNDQIRLLESLRHRTKMEAILSLIREKAYFDNEAVEFIMTNHQNSLTETVNDELGAPEMVRCRVHGLSPRWSNEEAKSE